MADVSVHRSPRFAFSSGNCRYEVYRTLVAHRDYDTLLLAWRQPQDGSARTQVVVKPLQMSFGRERRARALEEVELAKHLQHPNIAAVHGFAVHDEVPYIVMEHMRGCYLLTVMDYALLVGRKLSPPFAAYVAAEVANALDYAHRRNDEEGRPLNIIHRAVGPLRIRLGFNGRVKLANFGAAYSELRERLRTPPGLLRGDPAYLAPEILRAVAESDASQADPLKAKGIDGRADIFSLGLVLLEMLMAEYPLDPLEALPPAAPSVFPPSIQAERTTAIRLEVLANRLLRFHPSDVESAAEKLPAPLWPILLRALQPDPAARYKSAAEMRDKLRAYLTSLQRPFGAEEIAAELKSILEAATRLKRLATTNTIERGVLPMAAEDAADRDQ